MTWWCNAMQDGVKFTPALVTRLWQINSRYKYDPDPNNKTRLIHQKVSFQFWNLPLYFVLDLNTSLSSWRRHCHICFILPIKINCSAFCWHPDTLTQVPCISASSVFTSRGRTPGRITILSPVRRREIFSGPSPRPPAAVVTPSALEVSQSYLGQEDEIMAWWDKNN